MKMRSGLTCLQKLIHFVLFLLFLVNLSLQINKNPGIECLSILSLSTLLSPHSQRLVLVMYLPLFSDVLPMKFLPFIHFMRFFQSLRDNGLMLTMELIFLILVYTLSKTRQYAGTEAKLKALALLCPWPFDPGEYLG